MFFQNIEFTPEEEQLILHLEQQKSKKQIIQSSFKNEIQQKKKYKKLFRRPLYRKFLEEIRKEMK